MFIQLNLRDGLPLQKSSRPKWKNFDFFEQTFPDEKADQIKAFMMPCVCSSPYWKTAY